MDVISSYCFGQESGMLDANDFTQSFWDVIQSGFDAMPIGREWPLILDVMQALPQVVTAQMNPQFARFGSYMANIQGRIGSMVEAYQQGETLDVGENRSILVDMMESEVQGKENPVKYLDVEATVLLTAGSHTVAWTLSVISYHLLTKPKILTRVTHELNDAVKDPKNLIHWSALEQLPYLTALILEGLRLSYGLVARLARIAPDEAMVYEGRYKTAKRKTAETHNYVIPPWAAISILTPVIHHNEDIFPDSYDFIPERWLTADGARRTDLEKYLLSFSKGSRQCLGMK